ncbi:nSTAND1 domain-containing NTPase [Glycomyces salinus]|uniref:nSTAND1 domain-containing NTPase n=1 Tax=Glycomyces salinus TaxID=980294 RepID=UPI0018EC7769|nr:AAA family ATPase [Glycomyces salinus]
MPDSSPEPSKAHFVDPSRIQTRIEFFEALKRLHDQSGKTFREVSRHIELSYQAVHGYVNGKHLPHARGENGKLFAQLLRTGYGIDDPAQLEAWSAALDRVATAPGPRSADETVPYPGLRPFEPDEREWFFGREELTERIRDLLGDGIETGTRSMLLVGPSGSGKSSLVNVAVVATVEEDERFADWTVERITPGPTPAKALAAALEERGTERLVIVVDQMEELWSEEVDPAERMRFLKALKACAEANAPEAFVVVVMRADFYEHVLRYRFLTEIASDRQVAVGPMSTGQLTAAIEGPARAVHTEVEPDLTARLLSDLDTDDVTAAGTLPLLALALRDLWGRGSRGSMSAADYRQTGGLADIVKRMAEETWGDFGTDEQRTAKELLTHMVSVQEDLPLTRRHIPGDQFDALRGANTEVDRVAGRLIASRLVVLDSDGLTLAHDVILRAWPRLTEWIEADRQRLAARSELWRSVDRWRRHGRDNSYLYPRRRLEAIREQLGPDAPLSTLEEEFLEAAQVRAERTQGLRRALTATMAVLLAASLVSMFIAINQHSQAERQRVEAESRFIAARSEQLRESDPALARQLAVAAYATAPTLEARSALLSATAIPAITRLPGTAPAVVDRMAVSPDGDRLAAAPDNGEAWVWDTAEPSEPALLVSNLPEVDEVTRSVRWRADGMLYSAGDSGTVYLHDFSSPSDPRLAATATGPVGPVNFIDVHLPSGAVAVGTDTDLWLWSDPDLGGEPLRLRGPGGRILGTAFSPDGSLLAAAGYDGLVAVHDLEAADADSEPMLLDVGHERFVSIAFSPDGSLLAAGTSAGPVVLWDTGSLEPLTELTGPAGWADAIAFVPGTPFLASAATDGLWLWNHESGGASWFPSDSPAEEVVVSPEDGAVFVGFADGDVQRWTLPGPVLTSPTEVVRNVYFLGDGSTLAAASNDAAIWLWDVGEPGAARGPIGELRPEGGRLITLVTGTVDGSLLASADLDGRIWVWDLTEPDAPPRALTGLDVFSYQIAFSPDGTRIAAVSSDGELAVWDLDAGPEPVHSRTADGEMYGLVYSPDGETLVTSGPGTVQLWEAAGLGGPVELTLPADDALQNFSSLGFAPDGSFLAAANDNGNAYLWEADDLASAPRPVTLRGNGATIQNVSLSPDAEYLVGASYDGSGIIWSLEDPASPRRYAELSGSSSLITAEFSRDGAVIAGAGTDPAPQLWLTEPGAAIESICSTAGVVITREEWERHVPGVEYRPPC